MSSFYGRPTSGESRNLSSRNKAKRQANFGSTSATTPTGRRMVLQDRSNRKETPYGRGYQPGMQLTDIPGGRNDVESSNSDTDGDFDFGADVSQSRYTNSSPDSFTGTSQADVSFEVRSPAPSYQENSRIMALLQQQQSMLKSVLDGQKILEKQQDIFEVKLKEFESKVIKPADLTPSSSGSDCKRKRIVTRTLSVSNFSPCGYVNCQMYRQIYALVILPSIVRDYAPN